MTGLTAVLYFYPQIKDNPLFIAGGFVATVFPFFYLVWQICKPDDPVPELTHKPNEEKIADKQTVLHQIPSPPADFKGRDKELQSLLTSFDKGATITGLRGMGGIGKTALALVLAERLKDRFPDGQLFLNMLGTSTSPLKPEAALAHVIRSYHPEIKIPEDQNGLGGLYRSVLSGKKALILLDNAANREQVEPLLPPSGCALLITSRIKFALPGLEEKDLDVLPLEDAKKLLLEIEGRIGEYAEVLANLCGCLPLALRNAAYALKEKQNIRVADYVKRLEDSRERLDLVEASFTLSYELLNSELKKQWCLLSVFPADFDLGGAAVVLEMEKNLAEDALGELVKWSLVDFQLSAPSEGGRYRLHDLARDFTLSRLEDDTKANAQQRHAAYYQMVLWQANELFLNGGKSLQAGLDLFDSEWINIKAGQSWTKANSSASSEIAEICSNFAWTGSILNLRLSPRNYIGWLEAALACARQTRNREAEGAHLGNLGSAYAALGDAKKAIEFYEQHLVIAREIGDRRGEGAVLGNLGLAYAALGDAKKAIEFYEQALVIAREIEDRRGEGADLGNLGLAYADLGDAKKAIEFYEQALVIAREIGDRRGEGIALGNLGLAYAALGDAKKAIEFYEQALVIDREIGDRRGEGADLGNLGSAYADLGDAKKAIEFYEQRLVIAREIGDRRGEGNALFNLSLSLDNLGPRAEAIDHAKSALKIYEQIESPYAERVRQMLEKWQKQ